MTRAAPDFHFTEHTVLASDALKAVRGLVGISAEADGVRVEIYPELTTPSRSPNRFLAHDGEGRLVGYLALLRFEDDSAELVGVVHPEVRRYAVFSGLVERAMRVAREWKLGRLDLLVPTESVSGRGFAGSVGAQLRETEYRLRCSQTAGPKNEVAGCSLRPATLADRDLMAHLDVAAFESRHGEVWERLGATLADPHRRAWILECEGEPLGKIQVRGFAGSAPILHDICVLPDHQGQGHGRFMINSVVAQLLRSGAAAATLEVFASNPQALRVYEACGFEITESHGYWSLDL
jgi:GNAT superfamily N-acetyltransferase